MTTKPEQQQAPDATEQREADRVICPYCGAAQPDDTRCQACGGMFEPLSRQASQNQMGAWYVRDSEQPFRPGCNYATLKRLVERSMISASTILRGPTTHQFWAPATRTPGVAHLLGACHNCAASVSPDAYSCESCGAIFSVPQDRQSLGLGSVRLLPGSAPPDVVAESARPQLDHPEPPQPAQKPEATSPPNTTPTRPEPAQPLQQVMTQDERVSRARQATRDDDPPNITRSANRRLRHSLTRMRWMIALLIVSNVILLFALLVAINPRLQLGAGDNPDRNSEQIPAGTAMD